MTQLRADGDPYAEWVKATAEIHRRQSWNVARNDESDAEEERLHELWDQLSDTQREQLWELSADLQSIRKPQTRIDQRGSRLSTKDWKSRQMAAYLRRDWYGILRLARMQQYVWTRDKVDFVRGRAWMELGFPEAAVLFFENAIRMNPSGTGYTVLLFQCLTSLERWSEALAMASDIAHNPDSHARLSFAAAGIFYQLAIRAESGNEYYLRAVQAVDQGIESLKSQRSFENISSHIDFAYCIKALALFHLGRYQEAVHSLDQRIDSNPQANLLIAARGMLLLELGDDRAIDGLEAVAQIGLPFASAYRELARRRLEAANPVEALNWSLLGIQNTSTNTTPARADLLAIAAVAQATIDSASPRIDDWLQEAEDISPERVTSARIFIERIRNPLRSGDSSPIWESLPARPLQELDSMYSILEPLTTPIAA